MDDVLLRADEDIPISRRILHDFGYFGHYLHVHAGGRNGKQHILIKLLKAGGSLGQRELLEASCISAGALSEVLSKLEGEGLIARSRSDADRRQQLIELTDEGAAKAAALREDKRLFEERALSCLTDDEARELLSLLDRVAAHWKQLDSERRDA